MGVAKRGKEEIVFCKTMEGAEQAKEEEKGSWEQD